MSANAQAISNLPAEGIISRTLGWIIQRLREFDAAVLAQRDYERLEMMTDDELERLGLARDGIPAAVVRRMFARCG